MKQDLKNEAQSFLHILSKKVKEIKSDNNTLVLLICFMVSTLFWFLKALNDTYSTEVEFPIEFVNIPENYTLTGELPEVLIAKVEDDGFTIMRYKFAFVFSSFKFDVSKNFNKNSADDDGTLFVSQAALKMGVADALISRSNLVSVYPENVSISYSKLKEKRIPVQVLAEISTEKQHIVNGQICTIPDSVTVVGSNLILAQTKVLYTQPVRAQNLTDTLRRQVQLQKVEGLLISEKKVKLLVPVEPFTEKIVEVSVVGVNFPDSLRLRTFPGVASISCICGLSAYNKISPDDFSCFVDYELIKDVSNGHVDLSVSSSNDMAQRVKLRTRSVDYLIEKKK